MKSPKTNEKRRGHESLATDVCMIVGRCGVVQNTFEKLVRLQRLNERTRNE